MSGFRVTKEMVDAYNAGWATSPATKAGERAKAGLQAALKSMPSPDLSALEADLAKVLFPDGVVNDQLLNEIVFVVNHHLRSVCT